MKYFKSLIMVFSFITIACQERGMPVKIPYVFRIVDITGVNLVGDSLYPNRYYVDSIKYFSMIANEIDSTNNYFYARQNPPTDYYFNGSTTINSDATYQLRYNKNERDTIRVVYGKDNINVFKNNQLIFSKYNLSQVPPVEFNIIK